MENREVTLSIEKAASLDPAERREFFAGRGDDIEFCRDVEYGVRYSARGIETVWNELGSAVIPTLCEILRDPKPEVRIAALSAFAALRQPTTAELLIGSLRDSHSGVRQSAVVALRMIKNREAVAPLIECLSDVDARVRGAAARAIGDLHATNAADALIGCLRDPDLWVRRNVCNSLGKIGSSDHLEFLSQMEADKRKPVRVAAQRAVANIVRRESMAVENC